MPVCGTCGWRELADPETRASDLSSGSGRPLHAAHHRHRHRCRPRILSASRMTRPQTPTALAMVTGGKIRSKCVLAALDSTCKFCEMSEHITEFHWRGNIVAKKTPVEAKPEQSVQGYF